MKFDELLDNYPTPFFVIKPIYDEKGEMYNFRYFFINEAFARFLGKTKEELLHNDFISVFGDDYEKDWMEFFDRVIKMKGFVAETRFTKKVSRTLVIESFYIKNDLCANFIRDYYSSSEEDAVYKKMSIDNLEKAYYDYMTNFYNSNYLKEHTQLIEKSNNLGLIYLDIIGLKNVNYDKGHSAGDQLILQFTRFIREKFVGNDFFRIGGDKFLIVVMGLNDLAFNKLCESVKNELSESKIAAIGYKYYPNINDLDGCINEIDTLMKQHKKEIKRNGKK